MFSLVERDSGGKDSASELQNLKISECKILVGAFSLKKSGCSKCWKTTNYALDAATNLNKSFYLPVSHVSKY